jgi:hypothetical protein
MTCEHSRIITRPNGELYCQDCKQITNRTAAIEFTRAGITWRFVIDGRPVAEGQPIKSSRGEPFIYQGTYHPRKICAAPAGDPSHGHEYFPGVFGGEVQQKDGDTWTRSSIS